MKIKKIQNTLQVYILFLILSAHNYLFWRGGGGRLFQKTYPPETAIAIN